MISSLICDRKMTFKAALTFCIVLQMSFSLGVLPSASDDTELSRLRRAACSAGDCQNGGVCWPGPVTAATPPCLCPLGYTGAYCTVVDPSTVDYCAPGLDNPCKNGATCNRMAVSPFYSCSSVPGFSGYNCEINIDDCASRPCINGQCTDLVNSYNCSCYSGWEGSNCGTNHDDCFAGACVNGGRCVDGNGTFICECPDSGFSGSRCEIICYGCAPNPCRNGATCVDGLRDYSCVCHDGYTGKTCSADIVDCNPNKCQNGGVCYERSNQTLYNSALLPPPFNGSFSYSLAAGFVCVCPTGFYGETCSVNQDDCVLPGTNQSVCAHASSCTDGLASFTCHCLPGYEGANCSVDINECELFRRPCRIGAVCKDLLADYACTNCPSGFGGKNCSVRLTGCDSAPCRNGATCEPVLLRELPTPEHNYRCICDSESDFGGRDCSVRLPSFSFGLGGNVSSASFSSLPSASSATVGDSWTIELRLVTLSPGAFLMLLGNLSDTADTARLLVSIDAAGRLSAQLLLSNGSQVASLASPDSVATGRFVYVKISVSISGRALSLTVASAVRSASLSSAAPVPQLSGQLIIGGFSGAPSAPAPRPVPGGKKRLKRSAPALPVSVASSVPPGYTAFSGVIAAPRLNRDMPLILGPVTSSLLDGLPGAIAASDSTSVVEGLAVTRLCDTFAPCKNGGKCVDGFYYTYSCQCHKGFSGVSCSEDFPDCNPNPCQTDEVCLERSDSLNYNLRFLPWPFNEPFRYELAAGFKCIKSYGSLAKSDFRSSGFFYATLVLSAGMICSIILAGIVLAFLFRSGRLTLSKPGQPNPNSSSQPNRNGLTCDSEGAYTTASVDLIISHGNRMRQAGAADAAEGGDPVYEMTMDQQYANVGPSNTTTTFQLA